MNIFKNLKGHFCTITHHKMLVMKTCFKVGLYKQGLLHDLSKYTPIERTVQGDGFITKEGIFIILNIGLITALIRAASLSE